MPAPAVDVGAPRLAFKDILRHPRLPEARRVYLDRILELYGDQPRLVRLLIESGRFAVFQMTAVLGAAHVSARRETWLTIGRLKDTMAAFGLASDRHVDQLVGRLCAVGFTQLRLSPHDRRVRIVAPTDAMWAHDRDWLAAHVAPLAVLCPQHDYAAVLRRDAQFHLRFRRACAAFLPLGTRLMLAVSDMTPLVRHAGGFMVIAALLQAAMAERDSAHAAVPYADVGERFGISRTHVRKLLVVAERNGLVRLHARGGRRVELMPRLWASHDRAMAAGMYFHDTVHAAATSE
jgi:hypothetical protein